MLLLKKLDQLLGSQAVSLLTTSTGGLAPSAFNAILVIRPGGIGDAVLLIPSLAALRKNFPAARITVLAEQRNASVFELTDVVSEVLLYHKPGDLFAALKVRYDAVVDTEQWHRLSAVVARLVRAPVSIGFGTNERRKMFSHVVAYSHSDHETLSFFKLFEPLGIDMPQIEIPFLSVPEQAASRREELLAPLSGSPYVVLFPGATIAEKLWPVERFREVAARLNSHGFAIVIVGGRGEVADAACIASDGNNLNLAGKTTLAETAAIIEHARVVITGDSGVMHLAYGLGRPSVSLFGPSNVQKWAPVGENHIVIQHDLSCSPCSRFGYTPRCPSNVRCMAGITVDEVVEAVFRLLNS